MSDVTNWANYEKMIQGLVRDALNELGELINEKVKAQIDEDVYIKRNNQEYGYLRSNNNMPSYEFRESYESNDTTKSPNNPEVLIKSNPDKMTIDTKNFKHSSDYGRPKDIRHFLPEILAFNLSGDLFGENEWWHNRESFYYNALDKLKAGGWLNKTFKKLLRKRGLSVK